MGGFLRGMEGVMNREIKFRAKDKKTGQWRLGQFTRAKKGGCIVPCIAVEKEWDSGDYVEDYEIDGETLGQFTGIEDFCEGDRLIFEARLFGQESPRNGAEGTIKMLEGQWVVDSGTNAWPLFQEGGVWWKSGNIHEQEPTK